MHLFEFNNKDPREKKNFIFSSLDVSFKSLRADPEYNYSLYDCGEFYAEIQVSKSLKKIVDITGFDPGDERINLYIDFYKEQKDVKNLLNLLNKKST